MVILDLHEYEGDLISNIELKDDETGEKVPTVDVINLVQLARPKTPEDPHRYQVVKDDGIYVLFPLDKPGEVLSWPIVSGLVLNRSLTFHDFYTELQRARSGALWGNIPKKVDGATAGLVTLVSHLSDGSYDNVTWNSLDGRVTITWVDGGKAVSYTTYGAPLLHGGTRFAYNQ